MGGKNSSGLEGRSNFEFEPLYEREKNDSDSTASSGSSAILSGKKMAANFFDKFEDHWEDPIAEESGGSVTFAEASPALSTGTGTGPEPAYAPAPYRYEKPWKAGKPEPAASAQSHSFGPSSFTSEAYDTTGTGSGSAPLGPSNTYADHKKPNYWPHKLNSYYGDGLTSQLHNGEFRRPTTSNHYDGSKNKLKFKQEQQRPSGEHQYYNIVDRPSQHPYRNIPQPHQQQNQHQYQSLEEPTGSGSEQSDKKTSMIDRASIFYADHKLFTLALVSVVAALAALGVLLALYYSNPPTEVVTAKRELARSLEDPQLLKFLETPTPTLSLKNITDSSSSRGAKNSSSSSSGTVLRRKRKQSKSPTETT
jgi:hypothetical protein